MRTARENESEACRRASNAMVATQLTMAHIGIEYNMTEHRYLLNWSEAYTQALSDVEAENEKY
jgi:hypothetical protein